LFSFSMVFYCPSCHFFVFCSFCCRVSQKPWASRDRHLIE
jgi:hypothetical protein